MGFKLYTKCLSQLIMGIVVFTSQVTSDPVDNNGCKINTKDEITVKSSLLLYNNNGKIDFLYPGDNGDIDIDSGAELILACPGSNFKENTDLKIQKVQCLGDNLFGVGEEKHELNYYICENPPKVSLNTLGRSLKDDNIIHFKIGFELDDEGFLNLIDLYFNKKTLTPMYTVHKINKDIKLDQVLEKPSNKETSEYYQKITPTNIYQENHQKTMFDIYLASKIAKKYIDGKHFLTKGQLVPVNDFLYFAQQKATVFDVLTAPQFLSIKNGNWKTLEDAIRNLAIKRKIDLTVYSGVHGELNITGKSVYLARHNLGYDVIPVPTIFWKIVQHKDQSIVFLGYNNPFSGRYIDPAKQFCSQNLCDILDWITFDKDSLKGNIYCCSYQDIKNKINLPMLKSMDILY